MVCDSERVHTSADFANFDHLKLRFLKFFAT